MPNAWLNVLLLGLGASALSYGAEPHYLGPEVCAKCHKEIAASQASTAMANTWRGASPPSLDVNFDKRRGEASDAGLQYEVRRSGGKFEFSVVRSPNLKAVFPVEAVVGGQRHGMSFLARVRQIGGIPLERPVLVEGRYAYSPRGSLVLSPGFATDKPVNFEDLLGRGLSPSFEQRCLTCHGQPGTLGAGTHGGVRCESCHGPASEHVDSMQPGTHASVPVKPEHLARPKMMSVCEQCHRGLSSANHSDPVPEDLLVSSQVPALQNSECFIQSGAAVGCTDCHNPHQDTTDVAATSVKTCLRCHSLDVKQHAGICPVNAKSDCVKCHMPSIESNSFHLTDHWIRVHPEQGIKAVQWNDNSRSLVPPKREYLQIIVTDDRAKAEAALHRVQAGESFYDVTHEVSMDPTAPGGGFIGVMQVAEMESGLAATAAKLPYGGTSGIVEQGSRFVILHRLARDFKYDANRLFEDATALRQQGKRKEAIEKDQEALKVYPYFLRALVFMGTTLGEAGDAARAAEVLAFAVQSYPKDASAQFDLALTLANQPANQIQALRRTIDLEPDMVAVYESLGAALASSGRMADAIEVFRQGLIIDPLSAILNYDLGLALKQQSDNRGSEQALALAAKLDPEIAARIAAAH